MDLVADSCIHDRLFYKIRYLNSKLSLLSIFAQFLCCSLYLCWPFYLKQVHLYCIRNISKASFVRLECFSNCLQKTQLLLLLKGPTGKPHPLLYLRKVTETTCSRLAPQNHRNQVKSNPLDERLQCFLVAIDL